MECFELRKNYFGKIIKYIKTVFNIDKSLSKLTDRRKNPKYTTAQAVIPVLMGFLMRVRSFNTLIAQATLSASHSPCYYDKRQ
jgi:hypothetical protein